MTETLLIAGAGHAAGQAVSSLLHKDYQGRIVLVGEEPYPPYQRPPLSKKFLAGELKLERLFLRPPKYYTDAGVDVRAGARVAELDVARGAATLEDGETIAWDRCLLTTGSRVRTLSLPGSELAGVHYLRKIDDVEAMRPSFAPGRRLVIVGGGYIGLEVAAVAATLGLEVTVIELAERVMSRTVSPETAAFYEHEHRAHGVTLKLNTGIDRFVGDDRLTGIVTSAGEELPADLVLVAVGIEPAMELAAAAGLACEDGIVVDEHCLTSEPAVLAAGDCTEHPNALLDTNLRLESVHNALEQAKTAAATLLGEPTPYQQVPWFWSDQYDLKLQIVGLCQGYDTVVTRGDPKARHFANFYLREGRLLAVDAVNSPREFMQAKPLIGEGAAPDPAALADPEVALRDLAT